jgi:hypothetical protein
MNFRELNKSSMLQRRAKFPSISSAVSAPSNNSKGLGVHASQDLSEKNTLEMLPHDASFLDLLTVFSRGIHRGNSFSHTLITR